MTVMNTYLYILVSDLLHSVTVPFKGYFVELFHSYLMSFKDPVNGGYTYIVDIGKHIVVLNDCCLDFS